MVSLKEPDVFTLRIYEILSKQIQQKTLVIKHETGCFTHMDIDNL